MNRIAIILALALASTPLNAQTENEMAWPEATELLTRERLTAEACTRVIKQLTPADDTAALIAAEREYEAARASHNGLVVNLQVALIEDEEDLAMQTVVERIAEATTARRVYCAKAEKLLPADEDGTKGGIGDVIGGTIGSLIEAAVSIWSKKEDQDDTRRENIRNALEDTKWPAFGSIQP